MKKTLAILLVMLLTLLPLISGCSNSGKVAESSNSSTSKGQEQKTAEKTGESKEPESSMDKTLEVIWHGFNIAGYLPSNDSEIKKTLEEKFNIKITNVQVDNYNQEQLNVLLASGVEFDISTHQMSFAQLHELGLIRSIPEEYLSKYLPFFYNSLKNALGDDWKLYGSIDGEIYGIPMINEAWAAPMVLGVRTDWITAVGYDKNNLPKTLDGLEEMLEKFHTGDPDGNGKKDTYAIGRFDDMDAYVLGAFGVSDRYWYPDKDGNPMTYAIDENYKEALKVLQRWYKKGIYDPEVITDTRTETTTKFVENKVGGYYGIDWAFTTGHNISPLKAAKDKGIEIEMTVIPPVTGPNGDVGTPQYSAIVVTSGMTFGRNCTDEKLIRLLQVINAIYTDEDLYKYVNYGPKDLFYTEDEDGFVQTTDFYTNENMHTYGAQRYLPYPFTPESLMKWRLQRDRYEKFVELKDFPKVGVHPVSVFSTDAQLEYSASVNKIADEFYWKALTGEIDVDAQWDAYKENWLNAGGKQILEEKRELYNRMK